MNRREAIAALLVLGGAARPGNLPAQRRTEARPILIGWLNLGSRDADRYLPAFKESLTALGWREGSDYRLEERWADGSYARLEPLARELAATKPALIVAAPSSPVRAAAKAAPTTPIVQANGDPLAAGLVTSLARPGGMVTGVSNFNIDLNEKLLELLLLAVPKLQRIGFLADPSIPAYSASVAAAKRSIGHYRVEAHFADAARPKDLEPAISRLAEKGVQALVLLSSGWFSNEQQRFINVARAHRWPLIAGIPEYAERGALLSYGTDRAALYRRAAYYVDRILKGSKPGDLPIELPKSFELVVNLRTAREIGITVAPEVLWRANRVIE